MARQLLMVNGSGPAGCRTLGKALKRARDGAVISAKPGSCAENLVITARVSIVGDGPRSSIEIAPRSGAALTLTADTVMVTNFVLKDGERDLPVVDAVCGHVARDGCELVDSGCAAVLSRSTGSLALPRCRITSTPPPRRPG
ncbi:hypothetical protein ACWEQ3_50845 [Streptomyces mirabilis]